MNDPRIFSLDPVAPLVRSTCLSLRVIAIWMFLICLPGFFIVGNMIFDPSRIGPTILVFCYGFLFPFGNAVTLLICANQIERGKRASVTVAMWVAFSWMMLLLVLIFFLGADIFSSLTTPPSPRDESLSSICSIGMICALLMIGFFCGSLICKLRTISRKSSEAFLVLPKFNGESQTTVPERIDKWPEIE